MSNRTGIVITDYGDFPHPKLVNSCMALCFEKAAGLKAEISHHISVPDNRLKNTRVCKHHNIEIFIEIYDRTESIAQLDEIPTGKGVVQGDYKLKASANDGFGVEKQPLELLRRHGGSTHEFSGQRDRVTGC